MLHALGDRTWALEHGRELLVMDPGFDCQGLSADAALLRPGSTLQRLAALVADRGLPVGHVFVSHHHYDHAGNLPPLLGLRGRPGFGFTLVAHESSGLLAEPRAAGVPVRAVAGDLRLELPGGPVHVLATPGHSSRADDLCVWLSAQGVLFVGDLAQPQGSTYEAATFESPFSNHAQGDLALRSLARLRALPFERLLMGHDAVEHDRAGGLNALALTARVLERTRELAQRLVAENPGRDPETYVEWIFDTVAFERGLTTEAAERRKRTGHGGPCERLHRHCFYNLYDVPSVRFFVRAALSGSW